MPASIDITPSPRILSVLGDIDFKVWQCLCEIIDNSIDSFNSETFNNSVLSPHGLSFGYKPEIQIKLPSTSWSRLNVNNSLVIKDNAEGMTLESLEKSLKAGWSGNDPITKLGLFGMGFNIATARLGKKTEVITSTKGSKEFIKVTIDFNELESSGHFDAPIEFIPKKADEMQKHGTEVRITKLKTEHLKPLFQRKKQREILGKIYGRILLQKEIRLEYDSQKCKPFEHCIWNENRTGKSSSGPVPAVIPINILLDKKKFCTTCWNWLENSESNCSVCGEDSNIQKRERRIKGWVGIQRYFHADHYGIDLIRNGRVIKELDKSFFYWQDPETDEMELEYPRDGFQSLGRIVGQLEIDFVRVTHQKDTFVTTSKDWRDVRRAIRGDGPMQPQIAKSRGFAQNDKPIAKLFSAFRSAKAGVANLIPARSNGQAMLTDPYIDELIENFKEGLTDYQSDERWWKLVNQAHIEPIMPIDPEDPFEPPVEPVVPDEPDEPDVPDEPDNETKPDHNLSQRYSLDLFGGINITVIAEKCFSGDHKNGFTVKLGGPILTFTYWPLSSVFKEKLLQPADFLINELAYHFHTIAQNEVSEIPITAVELKLREKYFPDLHPTLSELQRKVAVFQDDLIHHFKSKISSFKINISIINNIELAEIRKKLSQNENFDAQQIEQALEKGEFMSYASFNVLKALTIEHPQLVFDGDFFSKKWTSKEMDTEMKNDLDELQSFLNDIVWFNENSSAPTGRLWTARTIRLSGSIQILEKWRV